MPLTHVCMWSGHGWKRVTVSEAVSKFPYGTSARSGLFMCDLCGQYVTLTSGEIREPYFKHSREEKSKDCPDRTFAESVDTASLDAQAHGLPIKLKIISKERFELELGLVSIPAALIGQNDEKIIIRGENSPQKFQYSLERLSSSGITYLSIGDRPCEEYRISYSSDAAQKVQKFWPSVIQGIRADGTLFDEGTGKKLPEDADVSVGHVYYLMTKRKQIGDDQYRQHIHKKLICTSEIGSFNTWYVYAIEAIEYDENAAKFFLDLHVRLTDNPIKFYPVWPAFIEYPYKVMHREDKVYFYLQGENVTSKAYPCSNIQEINLPDEHSKILRITCNDRQQVISAGRLKVLKYTYLWKDALSQKIERRGADVFDIEGRRIMSGTYYSTPPKKQISIRGEVDGFAEKEDEEGFTLSKNSFSAGEKIPVDNIRLGETVKIYVGLDCVWTARYEKPAANRKADDRKLIRKLESYHHDYIRISHAVGGFAVRLRKRPLLYDWFCAQVKKGKISRSALNILIKEEE